jgi:hypothetical protein
MCKKLLKCGQSLFNQLRVTHSVDRYDRCINGTFLFALLWSIISCVFLQKLNNWYSSKSTLTDTCKTE